jgi:glycine/D-amino acid oxidase-like deaminating enzyme
VCGSGASGRDGGFALTFWHHCLGLEGICGGAEALRLGHASVEAVTAIGRFCAEHDLDVEYRHDGWLWTATNTARRTDAHGRGAAPPRRAAPFVALSAEEVAARTGSTAHIAAVFEATAATMQPARLACGLRQVALQRGVRIFERSPMIEPDRGSELAVRTPGGRVRVGKVVLAVNAWGAFQTLLGSRRHPSAHHLRPDHSPSRVSPNGINRIATRRSCPCSFPPGRARRPDLE